MGKFDGRTSRLFYDIKAIQKEQNLTSVIGQAIVTMDYSKEKRDIKIETIFDNVTTLSFWIQFDKKYNILNIDATGNNKGELFYFKASKNMKKLHLSFRSKDVGNTHVQKMKEEYLENNTVMFLLKEHMGDREEWEVDVFNPLLSSFILTTVKRITTEEQVEFQGKKIVCTRYGISGVQTNVVTQFFVFDNEDNKLMKSINGNILFELTSVEGGNE